MMPEVSIHCENLTKSYGPATALAGITFEVNKGEIFGFIGPDGAGKTTLFRILTTLLLPDSGKVLVEGSDVVKNYRRLRQILGYMPGRFSLYQDLTVAENLQFFAGIFRADIKENYYLIRDIYEQIAPFASRRAGKLSGGMKQKLALCCALIHKPVVLILDEPTTGVDAVSRREFWEMLIRLKREHITIVVATPYMDEAVLCDRVALMQHGEIMAIDSPENITRAYPGELFRIKSANTLAAIRLMNEFEGIRSAEMFGDTVHVSAEKGEVTANAIQQYLSEKGMEGIVVSATDPGIEDCFIHLMKQSGSVIDLKTKS